MKKQANRVVALVNFNWLGMKTARTPKMQDEIEVIWFVFHHLY